MKKIISVIVFSFMLSLPTFALGNEYTFTRSWWDVVLDNSYTQLTTNGVTTAVNNVSDFSYISINDMFQGDLYNPVPYIYSKPDFISADQVRVHLPINVTVAPGQTITSSFYFLYKNSSTSNVGYTSTFLNNTSGSYEASVSVQTVDDVELGNLVVNGSVPSFSSTFFSSRADYVTVSYTNNTDSTITLHRLMLYFFMRDGTAVPGNTNIGNQFDTSLYIGVLALNEDVVLLPDSVEKEIINISNGIDVSLNKLDSISAQLQSISQQLASLNININNNSSTQNNFYQSVEQSITDTKEYQEAITQATPEQQEVIDELVEEYEALHDEYNTVETELSGLKNLTDPSNLTALDRQLNVSLNLQEGSEAFGNIFKVLSSQSILYIFLLISFTFGTFGFVLFGER